MAKYTFNVTQEDIDKGIKDDACYCPIARAAKRTLVKRKRRIEVGSCFLSIVRNHKGRWWVDDAEYELPSEASDFVRNFDSGNTVHPFSFEMEI